MTSGIETSDSGLEVMDRAECELMLGQMSVGRLAVTFAAQPIILPVNYRHVDGEILFRTFRGQKFHAAKVHQHVAFEIDAWDEELRTGWSVLVKGRAEVVEEWTKLQSARDLDLDSWADEDETGAWVRIIPNEITGRRLG